MTGVAGGSVTGTVLESMLDVIERETWHEKKRFDG